MGESVEDVESVKIVEGVALRPVGGWRSGPAGLEVGGVEHGAWGPSEMIARGAPVE